MHHTAVGASEGGNRLDVCKHTREGRMRRESRSDSVQALAPPKGSGGTGEPISDSLVRVVPGDPGSSAR